MGFGNGQGCQADRAWTSFPQNRGGGVDLGKLLERYDQEPEMRSAVEHNVQVLKCVRGGLRMAEAHAIDFDPRSDYWHPPERRLAVAYLADRWTGRVAPVGAVRELALRLVQHFEQARIDGLVTDVGVDDVQVATVAETLVEHVRRLGQLPAWEKARAFWPKLPATIAEHMVEFLEEVRATDSWERSFKNRVPWLAYLGCRSLEQVAARRAFFYGYANLWTTTNAYVRAGAQSFASILQNTKVADVLRPVRRWAAGENPLQTGFATLGKDDETPQNRAEYSTVIELYGFLNLHRQPFYNNLAERYRDWFAVDAADPFGLMAGVGKETTAWLDRNPDGVGRLAAAFRKWVATKPRSRVGFENVDRPRAERRARESGDESADVALLKELDQAARVELDKLTEREAAACALHLLLDSEVYRSSLVVPSPTPPSVPPPDPAIVVHLRPRSAGCSGLPLPSSRESSAEAPPSSLRCRENHNMLHFTGKVMGTAGDIDGVRERPRLPGRSRLDFFPAQEGSFRPVHQLDSPLPALRTSRATAASSPAPVGPPAGGPRPAGSPPRHRGVPPTRGRLRGKVARC